MLKQIYHKYKYSHPLGMIILFALVLRLAAAIFSKGYGMHDDHFGPIEQPWAIINDYSVWTSKTVPVGHSIIYPAIHYYFFLGLDASGISDPQDKMYIIRFLHAFYSLLIVFFGYKIAEIAFGKDSAWKGGILLASLWLMPYMSVRNLVEMVCIPPIMAGFYFVAKNEYVNRNKSNYIVAGAMFALAFIFRPQTLLFPFGVGLVLLFNKRFIDFIKLAFGVLVTAFLTQGIVDWVVWGYPFAAFLEYFVYNASHSHEYTSGPWYQYLLLLIGVYIPPISLLLLYGFIREWKRLSYIVIPVLLFLVFHSYFPNKQERFILPAIPILLILGIGGWRELVIKNNLGERFPKLLKGFMIWFRIVNIILLIAFTFTYSKKTRVESMYYLSHKNDVQAVVIYGGNLGANYPPKFYMNKYNVPVYVVTEDKPTGSLFDEIRLKGKALPNYAIMFNQPAIPDYTADLCATLNAGIREEAVITPSFIDEILYMLNPKGNKNQTAYIFKIEKK